VIPSAAASAQSSALTSSAPLGSSVIPEKKPKAMSISATT